MFTTGHLIIAFIGGLCFGTVAGMGLEQWFRKNEDFGTDSFRELERRIANDEPLDDAYVGRRVKRVEPTPDGPLTTFEPVNLDEFLRGQE